MATPQPYRTDCGYYQHGYTGDGEAGVEAEMVNEVAHYRC